MRGHSHPTLCEEPEKGGEARPASHTVEAAAAITGIHIHHTLTNSHINWEKGNGEPFDLNQTLEKPNADERMASGPFHFISPQTQNAIWAAVGSTAANQGLVNLQYRCHKHNDGLPPATPPQSSVLCQHLIPRSHVGRITKQAKKNTR